MSPYSSPLPSLKNPVSMLVSPPRASESNPFDFKEREGSGRCHSEENLKQKKQRPKLEEKPEGGHFRLKPELIFDDAEKSLIDADGDTSFFGGIGGIEKRGPEEND